MENPLVLKWKGGQSFETEINGFPLNITENPGKPGAIDNPKKLMLVSLVACTAFDVVSILNKMKVEFSDFEIVVTATQTDTHPRIYKEVHLIYYFLAGEKIRLNIEKAVGLSQEKYCGVSEMFRQFCSLTYEIIYN
ncbi:MAG: OsmC family protein [Chitinophagales bacterium]|nr:OsmC family protein [Chitinophagales bacterium]